MTKHKIVLLVVCAVLLVTAVVQQIMSHQSPARYSSIKDAPTAIEIKKGEGEGASIVKLDLDGNTWYVGSDGFKAEYAYVSTMISSIMDVNIYSKVATLKNDEQNERYGLDKTNAIRVTAKKGDTVIRTLLVGKASSTSGQSYVCIDGHGDINLVQGNYNAVFDKSEETLKSLRVYDIPIKDIVRITVDSDGKTFAFEKTAESQAEDAQQKPTDSKISNIKDWVLVGDDSKAVNSDEVSTWSNSLSLCQATSWLPDGEAIPGKLASTVTIKTASSEYKIEVYSKTEQRTTGEGDEKKTEDVTSYYGRTTLNAHNFQMGESSAKKYLRPISDFLKKE